MGINFDDGKSGWTVGVDVGGTFTDIVAIAPNGEPPRIAKIRNEGPSTVQFLVRALTAIGLQWKDIGDLVHGTTVVTNAIVQDLLADVTLVITEGFGDTLSIGRQNRRHLYRIDLPPKLEPPVPCERIIEVKERVNAGGQVIAPLDADGIGKVLDRLRAIGPQAIAVSFIHSYANPDHEREMAESLRQVSPYVALSHRINPETREYERTMTTVLAAGVMPLVAEYAAQLNQVRAATSRLHLFHSAGGMATAESLQEFPSCIGDVWSGRRSGRCEQIASELDIDELISFDMGGTTTDVCLIFGGRAENRNESSLGRWPIRVPMVAVDSIGAGGGSIARFDGQMLSVGPDSAGADPGPVCYGRGGIEPTVTDANVSLGYINPERPLGRSVTVDVDAARRALRRIGDAIDVNEVETARGIVRVANAAMARLLRRITVERGIDGRHSTLLAFGGAGPMHAVELARTFGVRRVLVPRMSGVFSAVGCLTAQMSYTLHRTVNACSATWNQDAIYNVRDELAAHVSAPFSEAGHSLGDLQYEYVAYVRYVGQSYAVAVPCTAEFRAALIGHDFLKRHFTLYGFAQDHPWELTAISARAALPKPNKPFFSVIGEKGPLLPRSTSQCWFEDGGPFVTPRYHRDSFGPGHSLSGPVIIEDDWSTVVIPPGAQDGSVTDSDTFILMWTSHHDRANRSIYAGGRHQRTVGDRRRDVIGDCARRTIAAAARGRRSFVCADRCAR